jgi:hypothetical protein
MIVQEGRIQRSDVSEVLNTASFSQVEDLALSNEIYVIKETTLNLYSSAKQGSKL